MPVFRGYSQTNRTAENGLLGIECSTVPALLRKAHEQSGFEEGLRRMQCDQKLGIRPSRVNFLRIGETDFDASRKPRTERPRPPVYRVTSLTTLVGCASRCTSGTLGS